MFTTGRRRLYEPEDERGVDVLEDELSGELSKCVLVPRPCSSVYCALFPKRTTRSGLRTSEWDVRE